LLLLSGVGVSRSAAQAAASAPMAAPGAAVTFEYENQQLQPAEYAMVIYENGAGQFHSQPGDKPLESTAYYQPLPQEQERAIQLSPGSVEKIFSAARSQKFFAVQCEDTKNKVAFQGTKQLSYRGANGSGSCTYNWSKIVAIQNLTALLEAIAFTLEEGRRLELEHKHDRLSLDAELGVLVDAAKDDRAAEIENIRPTLQTIIDDGEVMERARSRAKKLLGLTSSDRNSSASQ
jgi:hypothetical protein